MTILASTIIAALRVTLLDPAPGVAWSDADLLTMLNEAERNACMLRPELYTKRVAIPMVAGVMQALPAGGTVLLSLDVNATSGARCRRVDLAKLQTTSDQFYPLNTSSPAVDVTWYALDSRDPKRFHVLLPNNGTGSVVALYGAVPPQIAVVGTAISLDDVFELPLLHFMLAEAYAANTKRQDLTKAQFYRASFERQLGMSGQATAVVSPKAA